MHFADQQNEAVSKAAAWLRIRHSPTFYLGGYAGTGKSTIARFIAGQEDGEVRFAAFTGKAARVMRSKGCTDACTIHKLIYNFEEQPDGTVRQILTSARVSGASLIIIDECSMVNEEIGRDLLSFGIPVLVLGDPAQLPPISGAGFFTGGRPDFMLTDIHRQAAESPILRVATEIRTGTFKRRPTEEDGLTIVTRENLDRSCVPAADAVLVGKNATRQAFNQRLREIHRFIGPKPLAGETVICLRNDREKAISNGEIFRVMSSRRQKDKVAMRVVDVESGEERDVVAFMKCFTEPDAVKAMHWKAQIGTQQFDFGYAITVHKSQGSQWSNVVVFDESRTFGADRDRWLYTAVTRAAERLTLVV